MLSVMRCNEYVLICDACDLMEVLHSGDGRMKTDDDKDFVVHNIATAIKCARFHRRKGQLLCEDCFKSL